MFVELGGHAQRWSTSSSSATAMVRRRGSSPRAAGRVRAAGAVITARRQARQAAPPTSDATSTPPWRPVCGCCSCWPGSRSRRSTSPVRDERGEVVRKYDLCYPDVRVAVEYNGKAARRSSPGRGRTDLERREAIDDDGWRLLAVISSGIYKAPPSRPSAASTVCCWRAACRASRSAWVTSWRRPLPRPRRRGVSTAADLALDTWPTKWPNRRTCGSAALLRGRA